MTLLPLADDHEEDREEGREAGRRGQNTIL